MTEQQQKTIGIVLIDGFADWEFGLLAGGAAEHFGAKVVFLSPGGKPVTSIGGLEARPSRGLALPENTDLDALALIGSDTWTGDAAPDLAPLLTVGMPSRRRAVECIVLGKQSRTEIHAQHSHRDALERSRHHVVCGQPVRPPGDS